MSLTPSPGALGADLSPTQVGLARLAHYTAQPGQARVAGRGGARRAARDERNADCDHERSAPRLRISGTKSGKLVAMKAASSMPTGRCAASPMTRKAMAMR
jgi:hypothetical protein